MPELRVEDDRGLAISVEERVILPIVDNGVPALVRTRELRVSLEDSLGVGTFDWCLGRPPGEEIDRSGGYTCLCGLETPVHPF